MMNLIFLLRTYLLKYSNLNIAYLSTFPPTQCGIATYTSDLIKAIVDADKSFQPTLIELNSETTTCRSNRITIRQDQIIDYVRAADYLNKSAVDVVDIEHEFKIFGRPDGENIAILLDRITKPIVSTLHTIYPSYNERREKVFKHLLDRSETAFVFSDFAKNLLHKKYSKLNTNIEIIPHGVPVIGKNRMVKTKENVRPNGSLVFVAAGHLRESKGYDIALRAIASLRKELPPFHFVIVGANHPKDESSRAYRNMLTGLIAELNLSDNVSFVDHYLEADALANQIQSADIGLLPYTRLEQSSSGILALMVACGRPIVATPFQFAKSRISHFSGVIAQSCSPYDFAAAIQKLLKQRKAWPAISDYNYNLGKEWSWKNVATKYLSVYNGLL